MIAVSNIRELAEHLVRINFTTDEDIERWMRMHRRDVIRLIMSDNEYVSPEVHDNFYDMYVATSMLDFSNASAKLFFSIERELQHFANCVSDAIDELLGRQEAA